MFGFKTLLGFNVFLAFISTALFKMPLRKVEVRCDAGKMSYDEFTEHLKMIFFSDSEIKIRLENQSLDGSDYVATFVSREGFTTGCLENIFSYRENIKLLHDCGYRVVLVYYEKMKARPRTMANNFSEYAQSLKL